MFFFMSDDDFTRIQAIVSGVRTHSLILTTAEYDKLMSWINQDSNKFDEFCLYIPDLMFSLDVDADDIQGISGVIHKALKW